MGVSDSVTIAIIKRNLIQRPYEIILIVRIDFRLIAAEICFPKTFPLVYIAGSSSFAPTIRASQSHSKRCQC